jgi:hypothetical protein
MPNGEKVKVRGYRERFFPAAAAPFFLIAVRTPNERCVVVAFLLRGGRGFLISVRAPTPVAGGRRFARASPGAPLPPALHRPGSDTVLFADALVGKNGHLGADANLDCFKIRR